MSLFDITIADGVTVRVDSVLVRTTYGGLLEGLPCRKTNERLLGQRLRFLKDAHSSSGSPEVSLVEPKVTSGEGLFMGSPCERLPPLQWEVWLSSPKPLSPEPDHDYSHALLLCFTEQFSEGLGPEELLQGALASIVWSERARDCWY